jgi:hypothetical protein
LLTGVSGVTFAEAWNERVAGELDGLPVDFISRRHLMANKTAAGRPRGLADIDGLR